VELFNQVVWILVTIQTTLKVLHHWFRMGNPMTILALGQVAMFILVTEGTLELGMLGLASRKHRRNFIMTGPAEPVGNVLPVPDVQGLVRIMTGYTILKFLFLEMGVMALHTVGDVAMFTVMTDRAVKGPMRTGIVLDLTDLTGMTGVTNGNIIVAKDNMQGLMWILMTAQAFLFDLKMRASPVTLGAFGDHL